MSIINPDDSLQQQNRKLLKVVSALMKRVEHDDAKSDGAAYVQFERAALLEQRVQERTLELEQAMALLHQSNAQLSAANQEAQSARRDLADAIETLSEGFALFCPNDILVMFNSRFARAFMDTVTDLRPGMSFQECITQASQSRNLDLPPGMTRKAWIAQRMRYHKDRRVVFNLKLAGDRWLQISEHRTSNGGTVVVQTDVTDLVRLERAEREKLIDNQSRMIRATLDHLNQAVAIFDHEARLVGWNDKVEQFLPIPSRRLVLGAGFSGLVDLLDNRAIFDDEMNCTALIAWAQRDAPRPALHFSLTEPSGRILQTFAAAMPGGGFVMSFTDVTRERETGRQLAQLNQKLEQRVRERTSELEVALCAAERANASKLRFVAAASHDLLQPLAAAKLFLASLEESVTLQQRSVVEKASSALGAAEHIIDALMNISKLDEDALQLDMRAVALDDVLAPVVAETEILAQQKGLRLRYIPSTLYVHSDPSYLRRIVQNLLGNAVRYTDRGRVVLGVRRRGGQARIEVWDTGPGIAPIDQQVIFEEFHRLTPHSNSNTGLGLGLAIVERACQRLNHQIDLWSQPGQGSCFRVHAPVVQPLPTTPAKGADTKTGAPRLKHDLIVFLVENDAQMRRALTLMLETWGVNVIEADGFDSARDLLDDLGITPDLCLFDYHLGAGQTGVALYKQLHRPDNPIPTAIISASRDPQVLHDCAAVGLGFLSKPLDQEDLRVFLSQVR